MLQTCAICRHPQRDEIEQAMLRKVPCRRIAKQFQTSASTVSRHRGHTSEQFIGAGAVAKGAKNEDSELLKAIDKLLAEVHYLQRRLRQGRQRNTVQGADMILKVSREVRALLELRERFAGPRASAAQPQAKEQGLDDDAETLSEAEADQLARRWLAQRVLKGSSDATEAATARPLESASVGISR